jgi:hypothetical protein
VHEGLVEDRGHDFFLVWNQYGRVKWVCQV